MKYKCKGSVEMQGLSSKSKPWLVLVGGFLGAGKTTLLIAAAKELERRGFRTAIVLNDQGDALVDSDLVTRSKLRFGEVTGGCFCCKLSDLIEVMHELDDHRPDVIFAEPVGSCTDLSATTIRPLMEDGSRYRIAPLSVLVDPARAALLLAEDADPDLSFLFRKQVAEADLICFTKSDLYSELMAGAIFEGRSTRQLSAKSGQGVVAWLDEVLSGSLAVGAEQLEIDYDRYAHAEAALVWLNLQAKLRYEEPRSNAVILGPLLAALDADFTSAGVAMVHLKAIVSSSTAFLKGALCANGEQPVLEGALDASPELEHDLLLNLRSLGTAEEVRGIVEQRVREAGGMVSDLRISCFHPAAPKPERRISLM